MGKEMSTEGAALAGGTSQRYKIMNKQTGNLLFILFIQCRTFGAHCLLQFIPGLTAGPILFRPFGPLNPVARLVVLRQSRSGTMGAH